MVPNSETIGLHKSHAKEDGNTDLRPAVDVDLPEHGDGEQAQDPVGHGADAAVDDGGDGDHVVVHTRPRHARDADRALPEVVRGQALQRHEEEVDDRRQPDDGDVDPDDPLLPALGRQAQDEDGDGRSDQGREGRVDDLAEIPGAQCHFDTFWRQVLGVFPRASHSHAMDGYDTIGSVYDLCHMEKEDSVRNYALSSSF